MIRKRKPVSKLGIKFLSVVFSSAIISFLTFGLLFLSRYKIFDWFVGEETIEEATIHQIEELQNTITEQGLSKKDSEAIRKELRKYKDLTLQLYDDEATLDEISLSAKEEQAIVGTTSFWVYVYDPIFMNFTLEFSDGDAYLIVSSFIGITFIIRYVIIVLILSILLFIFLIMSFIHQKMKYILSIEEEMEYIKTGDFHHTIPYKGNDEITDLARQLNHLRNALYDNMIKEEEARTANYELVTAMSHDLRTPLTSLLGYLDILSMKIYKSDEARDEYIEKSKRKAEQIKELSDKLFNHFLVYSKDEELQLHLISNDEFIQILSFYQDDLKENKFEVLTKIENKQWKMMGDEAILQRVFDNIFSNIMKYAERSIVTITLQFEQNNMILRITNRKKKSASLEKGTQIGLKSVGKLMKGLNGSFQYEQNDEEFIVELAFPVKIENYNC
ncbi:sensor histidine kinase [Erysipelotrichaceae bacterium HCN-30851]